MVAKTAKATAGENLKSIVRDRLKSEYKDRKRKFDKLSCNAVEAKKLD